MGAIITTEKYVVTDTKLEVLRPPQSLPACLPARLPEGSYRQENEVLVGLCEKARSTRQTFAILEVQ